MKEMLSDILECFFKEDGTNEIPEILESVQHPIRRDELAFYLGSLHPKIIECVFEAFSKRGIIPVESLRKYPGGAQSIKATLIAFEKLALLRTEVDAVLIKRGFEMVNQNLGQLELSHVLSTDSIKKRLWAEVCFRFPEIYVKSMDNLLYYNWYAACFVASQNHSAMWGNYGDGHKGVCLKFNSSEGANGKPGLKLYRAVGISVAQNKATTKYGNVWHPFEKVEYVDAFPPIDFFTSIGRATMPKLVSDWYADFDGKISPRLDKILKDEEGWRTEYWKIFFKTITKKLNDWQHEDEHRIVLSSSLNSFESPDQRKPTYAFEDLAGITFGLSTSFEDKAKIISIIKEKCRKTGRTEFEFAQAYYSPGTAGIDTYPLKYINVTDN